MINMAKALIHSPEWRGRVTLHQCHSWVLSQPSRWLKATENKQGNTCQADKLLCCSELSAEAICLRDKEECTPKPRGDKLGEENECGAAVVALGRWHGEHRESPEPGVAAGSGVSSREVSHGNLQRLPKHFSSWMIFIPLQQTNKRCQLSESAKCFLSLSWICSSPFSWYVGTWEAWFCIDTALGL